MALTHSNNKSRRKNRLGTKFDKCFVTDANLLEQRIRNLFMCFKLT